MGKDWVKLQEIKVKEVTVDIAKSDHETAYEDVSTPRPIERSQTATWNQLPWVSATCLVCSVLLSIAATIVLFKANGKAVSQWDERLAPNVIISLLHSASGICITTAVVEAIAIAWWRKAMHGATVEELHNTWSFGVSSSSVIRHYRQFNFAALAALAIKISVIDGVLFQRAITTNVVLARVANQSIATYPTDQIPPIAETNSSGDDVDTLRSYFMDIVRKWAWSDFPSVPDDVHAYEGCQGICALNVSAPGYIVKCTDETQSVDIIANLKAATSANMNGTASLDLFGVNFSLNWPTDDKNYTWIGLNTTSYHTDPNQDNNAGAQCLGLVTQTQCEMRQAMIKYPVQILYLKVPTMDKNMTDPHKYEVSLGVTDESSSDLQYSKTYNASMGQLIGFDFKDWINTSFSHPGGLGESAKTSDGGIFRALQDQYRSRKYVTMTSNDEHWSPASEGQFARLLPVSDTLEWEISDSQSSCPSPIQNPLEDIIASLNILTFMTASDPRIRPEYLTSMTAFTSGDYLDRTRHNETAMEWKNEGHYTTKKPYMYAALSASIICVLIILPAFYGFWELERRVSLSPIEIANAFHAPMLASLHPSSGYADDIMVVAGQQYIRYAPIADPETGGKYGMMLR